VLARLLTVVDINDADDDGPDARRMSVRARHEAVLAGGRRIVLLDDRGWSGQAHGFDAIWACETVEEMEQTARNVVGPDEAFGGHTQADMDAGHWAHLARILRRQGVEAEPAELQALPHDVELSARVLARIARGGS
jgi:hypothetical protein